MKQKSADKITAMWAICTENITTISNVLRQDNIHLAKGRRVISNPTSVVSKDEELQSLTLRYDTERELKRFIKSGGKMPPPLSAYSYDTINSVPKTMGPTDNEIKLANDFFALIKERLKALNGIKQEDVMPFLVYCSFLYNFSKADFRDLLYGIVE